jgi:hypothetical protein
MVEIVRTWMKSTRLLAVNALAVVALATAQAAVVSTTVHGFTSHELDPMIAVGDLIAGQLGAELPPLRGWHPANTDPLDHLPAFTDGAGVLASGLTGLLNDFPDDGIPTKTVRYSFPATDISSLSILTGNNGGDGRIFSTTVVRYSINEGATFDLLGYFQSDPSGTINNAGTTPRYYSTMVSIYDDASPLLRAGVTDLIFELYAVDNTGGQMRDPFGGFNPFTETDDGLNVPNSSPLVLEIDVLEMPPRLSAILSGTNLELVWLSRATSSFVQAASQLSTPDWADLDPQPVIQREGITNKTSIATGSAPRFFRLRVQP